MSKLKGAEKNNIKYNIFVFLISCTPIKKKIKMNVPITLDLFFG
jgi:hypothetical protein